MFKVSNISVTNTMQSLGNKNNRLLSYKISVMNTLQSLRNKNNRLLRNQISVINTIEIRITDQIWFF